MTFVCPRHVFVWQGDGRYLSCSRQADACKPKDARARAQFQRAVDNQCGHNSAAGATSVFLNMGTFHAVLSYPRSLASGKRAFCGFHQFFPLLALFSNPLVPFRDERGVDFDGLG